MNDANDTQLRITTEDAPREVEQNSNPSWNERAAEFRKQLAALQVPAEDKVESKSEIIEPQIMENNDDIQRDDSSDERDIHGDNFDRDSSDDVESDIESRSIPKKRFNKEIEKRREIELELQKEREARIRMETELNLFNKAAENFQQKTQQKPSIDPIDEDAHNYYTQKFAAIEEQLQKKVEELSFAQTQNKFESTVNIQAAEFSKQHSDFEDAYKFVINTEIKTAKLMGLDDHRAEEFALQKLQPLAWNIYNNGGNVAEAVYRMAQNYGYNTAVDKKRPAINLGNIQKNSARSQSIIDDVPAAVTSMTNNAAAFAKMENFSNLDRHDGRGTDPAKFRKALAALQEGKRA